MTHTELLTLFTYQDGKLFWKVARTNNIWVGKEITATNEYGYVIVGIGNKLYQVSRIIFCMHHGYMPEIVDHENRNTLDNKIDNLRAATKSQNGMNSKTPITSTTGIKGVTYSISAKRWISSVQVNKKQHKTRHLTKEEAILATLQKREFYHKEFANNG